MVEPRDHPHVVFTPTNFPTMLGVGAFFFWWDNTVDGMGKEVRPRLTPGLRGKPRG